MKLYWFSSSLLVFSLFSMVYGELPSDLPGEEISQEYLKWTIPKDTTKTVPSKKDKNKDNALWYNKVAKTWDAPPLAEQMSSDKTNVPMGMGGIFFPRFTQGRRGAYAARREERPMREASMKTSPSGKPNTNRILKLWIRMER